MRLPIILAVLLVAAPLEAAHLPQTEPDPSLSPQDVVSIQIEALQHNDTPYKDRGIEVTFNFASPKNKSVTGPLERFKAMVRSPGYRPMINHRGAEYKTVKVEGDFAQVDVILEASDGQFMGYRFTLSRQRGNQFEGSWMTSTVSLFNILSL